MTHDDLADHVFSPMPDWVREALELDDPLARVMWAKILRESRLRRPRELGPPPQLRLVLADADSTNTQG